MKTKTNTRFLLYHKIIHYSLLGVLIGIFLLPQLASLSSVSPEKIIELTNKERIAAGMNILTANQLLTKAAHDKGLSIFSSQAFQHNIGDRKFSDWIREAGYDYSYAGENMAVDFMTSEGVMRAWMRSETHKKNLLNPSFSEIGIAVMDGSLDGKNTTLIVQIFGSPHSPVTSSITSPSVTTPSPDPAVSLTDNDAINFRHCFDYAATVENDNMPADSNDSESAVLTAGANTANTLESADENTVKTNGFLPSVPYPAGFSFGAIILALGSLGVVNMRRYGNLFFTGKNKQLRLPLK